MAGDEFPTWSDEIFTTIKEQLAWESISQFVVSLDTNGKLGDIFCAERYIGGFYLATDEELVHQTKTQFIECRSFQDRIPGQPDSRHVFLTDNTLCQQAGKRWRELIKDFAYKKIELPTWSDNIHALIKEYLIRDNAYPKFLVNLDARGNLSETRCAESHLFFATDGEIAKRTKILFMECRQLSNRIPVVSCPNDVSLSSPPLTKAADRWRQLITSYASKINETPVWSDDFCFRVVERLSHENFKTRFVANLDDNGELSDVTSSRLYLATDDEIVECTKTLFMECRQPRIPAMPEPDDICLNTVYGDGDAVLRWRKLIMSYAAKWDELPTWSDDICFWIADQLGRENFKTRFVVVHPAMSERSGYFVISQLYLATYKEIVERTKRLFIKYRQFPNRILVWLRYLP